MEKISEKDLEKLNFIRTPRGRNKKESPFYKMIFSLMVGEVIMMEEENIKEETGRAKRSCLSFIYNKKIRDFYPSMKGKKFSSFTGILDGKKIFVVKRIK